MTLKDQWKKMKENWLIILVLVVVVGFFYIGDDLSYRISSPDYSESYAPSYGEPLGVAAESVNYATPRTMKSSTYIPSVQDGFAPEVEERKVTKTTSLATKIERGTFQQAEQQLKGILYNELPSRYAAPVLLSENVQKYGEDTEAYFSGSYILKVDARAHDTVISQLKEIGEVQSFSENAQDITATYTNLQTELEAERARLERYNQMLVEATLIADKIDLNDRIFNQERVIKYLEESLENQDQQVAYSTIYVQITEERSQFAGIAFVSFGQLITSLVSSASNLLELIFTLLPWAIVIAVVWLGVRWVRKKR